MKKHWITVCAAVLTAGLLAGCGLPDGGTEKKTAEAPVSGAENFSDLLDDAGNFKNEAVRQQLSEKYDAYIRSYLEEMNEEINDDMRELTAEIGSLQSGEDVRDWCEDYREFYQELQQKEREFNAAEMIAPEAQAEQHRNLAYAIYTLSQVCAYIEPSVTEAENGNVQPLKDNADTFRQGYQAALTLYQHSAAAYGE